MFSFLESRTPFQISLSNLNAFSYPFILMTINTKQRRSLNVEQLDLSKLCFAHNQVLYVGCFGTEKSCNRNFLAPNGRTANIAYPKSLWVKKFFLFQCFWEEGMMQHATSCREEMGLILEISFPAFIFSGTENRHNNFTNNAARVLIVFLYNSY